MSEQQRFDQVNRDRATVHVEDRLLGVRAQGVDGLDDQFLARAGGSRHQDWPVRERYAPRRFPNPLQPGRRSNQSQRQLPGSRAHAQLCQLPLGTASRAQILDHAKVVTAASLPFRISTTRAVGGCVARILRTGPRAMANSKLRDKEREPMARETKSKVVKPVAEDKDLLRELVESRCSRGWRRR